MKTPALLTTSLLLALFNFASPARAATVITAGTDAELRAAVAACGIITFNFDGVITLTNTIDVTCAVTIDASGHSVVLSGGGSHRVFNILSGGSLTLTNLTVANGRLVGTNGVRGGFCCGAGEPGQTVEGAGVYLTNATLFAVNCVFTNCTLQAGNGADANTTPGFPAYGPGGTARGGAINAVFSVVLLQNCQFVNNTARAGISGITSFVNDPIRYPGAGEGGAVHLGAGTLLATNSVFRGNGASSSGGAIAFTSSGGCYLHQCEFASNLSGGNGGAVTFNGLWLEVSKSNFRRNSAAGSSFHISSTSTSGGAMVVSNGEGTITDCDFDQNLSVGSPPRFTPSGSATGGSGSGGALRIAGGVTTLSRSSFHHNSAVGANGAFGSPFAAGPTTASGGAIACSQGNLEILNRTLAHNSVQPGYYQSITAAGTGGALHAAGGLIAMGSCTIASNRVTNVVGNNASGGGIHITLAGLDIGNTLLQGNAVNATPSSNVSGSVIDYGHNLSSDATPAWSSASLNNTDSRLLPLAENGGPTPTMALRAGSPALNFADPGYFPATDQRGAARPQGAGPDAGAWEGAGGQITLSIFRENSSTNRIIWLSDTGLTYRVEVATELNAWSTLTTGLPGNGETVQYRTTNSGLRYFRVATEP